MEDAGGGIAETKPQTKARRVWHILRWPVWTVLVLYIGVVVYRVPAMGEKQKTAAAIAFIQSQKITTADATGADLPAVPDEALNNATLAGADANHNGIRDDVELAIFKLHPDSARIRAAELQYALESQLELTQVFNQDTWVAEAKYEAHSINCLGDAAYSVYSNAQDKITKSTDLRIETENLVFNTTARKLKRQIIGAYEVAFVDSSAESCDIDLASLKN